MYLSFQSQLSLEFHDVSTRLQDMLDWVKQAEEQQASQQPLAETWTNVNQQHQTHTVSLIQSIQVKGS